MSWAFFSILAATFWSTGNIIDKIVLSKLVKNPMTPMIMLGIASTLVAVIVGLGGGLAGFTLSQTLLALLAGITYAFMNVCYLKAVQLEEISKIIPLFSLSPLMIAIVAAITLHEIFTLPTYLGIALILVGAITLSVQRLQSFSFNRAFWLMVGAAASITATEVIQKYLLGFHPYWSVFGYSRLGSLLVIVPVAWVNKEEIRSMVRGRRFKAIGFMSVSETLNVSALLSIVFASSIGYVTLVNAITQVQPFIVLALSVIASFLIPHIFKEEQGLKIFARKFGSISIMFVGVILLLKFQ